MLDSAVEMDRILRPGGVVIVEDIKEMLKKFRQILRADNDLNTLTSKMVNLQ